MCSGIVSNSASGIFADTQVRASSAQSSRARKSVGTAALAAAASAE